MIKGTIYFKNVYVFFRTREGSSQLLQLLLTEYRLCIVVLDVVAFFFFFLRLVNFNFLVAVSFLIASCDRRSFKSRVKKAKGLIATSSISDDKIPLVEAFQS